MIPEGPIAESIAQLTLALTVIGAVVYAGFLIVLVIGIRRRGEADDEQVVTGDRDAPLGLGTPSSRWLVIGGGVVLPAVVVVVVFAWTLETMLDIPVRAPADAMTIEVVGERWQWNVRYPESGIELTDELVIPAGRPVALELRSVDVIHSFWVPQLAGKLDAFPDGTNVLVVEAAEPGEFRGQCAEFCGLLHADMIMVVTALSESDFERWTEANR